MAKKNLMNDVLAAMTNTSKIVEEATNVKHVVRKKTDVGNIMADVFAIDARLESAAVAKGDLMAKFDAMEKAERALTRQRLATALSNIPKAELDDRSDEGRKALKGKMAETRKALYDAEYDNDSLPAEMPNGQPTRFTSGKIKFGVWPRTKRTWNIGSQLIGDVEKYGWEEIFKGTKVVPYAETQAWSINEEGEIVKEKVVTVTPPADGYALIEAAIKSLEQRLNRKDVDLTSKQGMEMADKAMLVISKAAFAAKAKATK